MVISWRWLKTPYRIKLEHRHSDVEIACGQVASAGQVQYTNQKTVALIVGHTLTTTNHIIDIYQEVKKM